MTQKELTTMTDTAYELPNISVDVVPVIVNESTNQLEVIIGRRIFEPYLNEFALPGVLLTPHERLDEAARRALKVKTGVDNQFINGIYDLGTFDNPDRDPRGATVSIAKLVVVDSSFVPLSDNTLMVPLQDFITDERQLPFDHNTIIAAAAAMFAEKFLSSKAFTRVILGSRFTTSVVRGLLTQMNTIDSDHSYDLSNLTRQLKSTGWVDTADAPSNYVSPTSAPASQSKLNTVMATMGVDLNQDSMQWPVTTSSTSTSRGRPSRSWIWN
jgi:8-oxo-dGTP diphosphatase